MKKRKIKVHLPKVSEFSWNSPYNIQGKISVSTEELGDGGSTNSGNKLAVKHLKVYSVMYACTLVDTYEKFLYVSFSYVPTVGILSLNCVRK